MQGKVKKANMRRGLAISSSEALENILMTAHGEEQRTKYLIMECIEIFDDQIMS